MQTPECVDLFQEWVLDMATHFKSLDQQHLLTVGSEGARRWPLPVWPLRCLGTPCSAGQGGRVLSARARAAPGCGRCLVAGGRVLSGACSARASRAARRRGPGATSSAHRQRPCALPPCRPAAPPAGFWGERDSFKDVNPGAPSSGGPWRLPAALMLCLLCPAAVAPAAVLPAPAACFAWWRLHGGAYPLSSSAPFTRHPSLGCTAPKPPCSDPHPPALPCPADWAAKAGQDFVANNNLPLIDFAAVHLWPTNWNV